MHDAMSKPERLKWLMVTTALATPALVGAAILMPKSEAYAATDRFALTALVFAGATIGLAGFSWARQRHREIALLQRYGGASSAVRDTLSYLRNERRLARRGQFPALLGSVGAFGLYILAHWPQLAALAPFRSAFGGLAAALLIAIPVLALRNRGHLVNTFFLRRYLTQQLDHLGYRPPRPKNVLRRDRAGPAVTVTGPGHFEIGGRALSFDDFTKNAIVFGQTGSGKTVCVLNSLLEALIASLRDPNAAGLILDAKGDFRDKIEALCAKYGRSDDLVILDPSSWAEAARTARSIGWNPLDNDDDALEIATRLVAALRLLGLEVGSEGTFFVDSAKTFLRHAIGLVRAAALSDAPSLIDVYRLSQEGEEETPLYHELIRAIGARYPEAVPAEVLDNVSFMERDWGPMPDRQKAGVRGSLVQLLDEFLVHPFREIFTGRSTVSVAEVIDQGKILYVHMPSADRERMSRVVNTLIKLEFERDILKRPRKSRPSFMLCDEFQIFYTSGEGRGDSDFFERSRESRHANIVAAQNMSAFLKRTKNPHDVKNFLGNCAVKIFLRNTEEETNRWSSALFGQRSEIVITTSEQAAIDGGWSRRRHTSYGRATRALPRVPPEAFTQLAIPLQGDPARQYAASVIHLASRGEAEHHRLLWPVNPLR
jgi:type IV secretory pathway TraG/TraD family ATPase VirD4